MPPTLSALTLAVLLAATSAPLPAASGSATPLPVAAPDSQGMSGARLARLHDFIGGLAARGDYLGAVTLLARNGRIVDWRAYGHLDLARTRPMPRDAIFRIYSMSKTVTAVAMMTLMEEGRFALDDPVGKYLPELRAMRVHTGGPLDAPQSRPVARPLTIRHLLTHTPGFAVYGKEGQPLTLLFERAALGESRDLADYVARLAPLPLAHEPGAEFHYDGVPIQVAGRLVEVLSGMPLDVYLERRIFAPLGMRDTGFEVPLAKRARIAAMTTTGADGRLAPPAPGSIAAAGERSNPYFSGAGGLYSTAGDYARFAQMLLDGGSLDGVTILGRKTVDFMMQNQLTQLDAGVRESSPGEGFGLGGSVVLDTARRGRPGSVGQYGWSGAAGTYYTVDRQEKLVAILMTQHLPQGLPQDPPRLAVPFYNLVYQSLVQVKGP
ncbi:beta-lactamase family protein [Massilia sp. G4R7]|uniref:Beta-lactamase family protein n=1 Tax=Massilia phyllostachyos TaxID=2898585 RepID=A0ABS8Q5D1_9BURK|nr:serine hydrolase domain-containing protein [Massilia phyllostachyos]MCD2516949.1 beta-lactamase family protein [Massilia phyllostachyos]